MLDEYSSAAIKCIIRVVTFVTISMLIFVGTAFVYSNHTPGDSRNSAVKTNRAVKLEDNSWQKGNVAKVEGDKGQDEVAAVEGKAGQGDVTIELGSNSKILVKVVD